MNDHFQSAPPSYMEVTEKSAPSMFAERSTMYAVHQQEPASEIRYPTVNSTIPLAYTVHAMPLTVFARRPVQCTCPNCRSMIVTRVEHTNGLLTWLLCLLLILFGCGLGCCFIPFCVSDLQNVQHHCPQCDAFVGEYRPL